MVEYGADGFDLVCAALGGFVILFGLVSSPMKEKLYLSGSLISFLAGVLLGPYGANLIRPLDYAHDDHALARTNLLVTRLVLGIQLVLAGVQLPAKYLRHEWKSLAWLLGPGMTGMWLCTSLLVWAAMPNFNILHALVVASCVTPTDPVLSNSIVHGKFADENVPQGLQKLIIAESGTNDGLGYPFLFLPLFLIRYATVHTAVQTFVWETLFYQCLLGCLYGAVIGWTAKELLHWAERRRYIDRESFAIFAIALALFTVGTAGLLGSDDVLACFIAGNFFTWDDWFCEETAEDSLQPAIDMLVNMICFIWLGAVCPWNLFAHSTVISLPRLLLLGLGVLVLRRLPVVLLMWKRLHQVQTIRHASFLGFFGPIGVSAIFYLYIALEFLRSNFGPDREDIRQLGEALTVVIWFLVTTSSIIHGLAVPTAKLTLHATRSIGPPTLATVIDVHAVERQQGADHLEYHAANKRLWRLSQSRQPSPASLGVRRSRAQSPETIGEVTPLLGGSMDGEGGEGSRSFGSLAWAVQGLAGRMAEGVGWLREGCRDLASTVDADVMERAELNQQR